MSEILNEILMSEILNDENIMDELKQKVAELEAEKALLESKKLEADRDADITEETKAQMKNVIDKVSERIKEIQTEILNAPEAPELPEIPPLPPIEEIVPPIEEIVPPMSEILSGDFKIPPKPAAAPIPPVPPIPPAAVMSKHEQKLKDFERWVAQAEREIAVHERKKSQLEDSRSAIEDKLEDDLNDATRERLEEMMEELEDQIDTIDDKIDELNDKIEEINDEREEFENEYVDENLINEVKDLPGISGKFDKLFNFDFSKFDKLAQKFDEKFNQYKGKWSNGWTPDNNDATNDNTAEAEEINVKLIDDMKERYARIPNEEREQRRRYRRESKYNVNFCTNATIDSFCCYNTKDGEHPENLINDDGLKTKWCASERHISEIMHPYWVIIDLGGERTFNYVQIFKASEGGEDRRMNMSAWRIEVCRNNLDKANNTWTEFNQETSDISSIYEKQFETQTGRYIRLFIDAPEADPINKGGHVRLYGFKIKLRSETGEDIFDYTKKATIESCCDHNRNERPEHILNDNMKHKWCATRRQVDRIEIPHWVIIDFGESQTFNHLRIVKASEGDDGRDRGNKKWDMSAWRLEASDDKENWKEFNKETNDQTSIYIKTFEPVTGRYVRLWVDGAEANPNHKNGHVRIYDLRIEMLSEKSDDKPVTFDDIIAIAPFAKKETLDRLADKLADAEMVNFAKLKEVAPFLSPEAINKLILKAFEKDDFNAIFALAPHASKETIEEIALKLDSDLEFDKIKALAPFLGKEAITGILISNGKIDMGKLRQLAPLLGSALIDEIVRRMF